MGHWKTIQVTFATSKTKKKTKRGGGHGVSVCGGDLRGRIEEGKAFRCGGHGENRQFQKKNDARGKTRSWTGSDARVELVKHCPGKFVVNANKCGDDSKIDLKPKKKGSVPLGIRHTIQITDTTKLGESYPVKESPDRGPTKKVRKLPTKKGKAGLLIS